MSPAEIITAPNAAAAVRTWFEHQSYNSLDPAKVYVVRLEMTQVYAAWWAKEVAVQPGEH